jgi:hypothetical protein
MFALWRAAVLEVALLALTGTTAYGFTSYANEFIDPTRLMNVTQDPSLTQAKASVVIWADQYNAMGPWSASLTQASRMKHH